MYSDSAEDYEDNRDYYFDLNEGDYYERDYLRPQINYDIMGSNRIRTDMNWKLLYDIMGSNRITTDMNCKLLNAISRNKIIDYEQFMDALKVTNQTHVVNFLMNDGGKSFKRLDVCMDLC